MKSLTFSFEEIEVIRNSFPFFNQHPQYVYFNSAATTLKPQMVVDGLMDYYYNYGVNSNRGLCPLSQKLQQQLSQTRERVAQFIGANSANSIVFTHGTTSALNMVAKGYGASVLQAGDIIYTLATEHSSSILPWIQVAESSGAIIQLIPLTEQLEIDFEQWKPLLNDRVKFVVMSHMSNTTGVIYNIEKVTQLAREYGIKVVIDGAQSMSHTVVNVEHLGVDFFAFSGHKMFGTGSCGVLYIQPHIIQSMQPLIDGGGTHYQFDIHGKVQYLPAPYRLEAGTMPWADILSLSTAIAFWEFWGRERIHQYIQQLTTLAIDKLQELSNVIVYNAWVHNGIILCNVKGINAQDVEQYLSRFHVSVRSGSHCSSLSSELFPASTLRISLSIYNTPEEIMYLSDLLSRITLEDCIMEAFRA